MPTPSAPRYLTKQADNTFVVKSSIPTTAQTWTVGSDVCWAVVPASGQPDPAVGDVATYLDLAQPWIGASFAPPAPVYPPIEQQLADAKASIAVHAQSLLEVVNGTPDIAAQAFTRLRQLEALETLTEPEADELAALQERASTTEAISAAQTALDGWVDDAARTPPELDIFIANGLAADPYAATGIAWPAV